MKILGIEHLGIAVDSINSSAPFWKHVLNIAHSSTESVEKEQLLVHPDQSVVSLLRLFNPSRVFFHQLLVRKRHRVHSHQWIFRHVRSPMRPRTLRHF
mgnify:CR=1 FL=1